jgi:pyridoxal phosphate phosphatase PHOSPHO2
MFLVVFDFDHTIIDANSDIHVNKLFPSEEERLTAEKNRSQFDCWTDRMQEIFRQLHKHHIKEHDYIQNMEEIPLTNGFSHLITYLHSLPNSHLIIVSDSNLVFINTILKHHHLDQAFQDIFTNPAYFNKDDQCLIIEQYGQQTCPTCPSNMCKREIIEKYLRTKFSEEIPVLFIGDGHNDVCAAKNLRTGDLVCARSGYRMAKELKQEGELGKNNKLQANFFEWNDGKEIEDFIKENWLNKF